MLIQHFQMTTPLVSAIIPAYNRPDFLKTAVESVLTQDYPNLELILADDCSTADISEAVDLVKQNNQSYLRLPENSGPAAARNLAVQHSQGEYLAFLDSDDHWLPEKISKQVLFHQENPEYKISQCREIWYRNKKRVNPAKKHEMQSGNLFANAVDYCVISSSSIFMTKELYEFHGGYPEKYRICEDYALWLKITAQEQIGLVEEKLTVKHGGHTDQLSASEPALDRYRLEALLELNKDNLSKEQQEIVDTAIKNKAKILYLGAKKRNLPEAERYATLI